MKTRNNPFKLRGYHGPALFCDREMEVKQLTDYANNDVNTTLFSYRRMGKTGLIRHIFHLNEQNNQQKGIYIDIYDTQNIQEFTNRMATAILKAFPEKNSIGKKFLNLIKGFSPVISYDQFTGSPEVKLSYADEKQKQHTMSGLFHFLEQQNTPIVVAIDEFQQIVNYPEQKAKAMLRTSIQHLKNINFIFSGSHKHLLLEIFNNAKRPFYASTTHIQLGKIPIEKYKNFIIRLLEERNKSITDEAVDFILDWTNRHTYYTQALCNKVFIISSKNITLKTVFTACDAILTEQEGVFFQYRSLLTGSQWNLLRAIAKEQVVKQPTGAKFINKHQLGNPASVRRSLQSLVEKEMVIHDINEQGNNHYQVYDCFLSRWLAKK